MINQVPPMVLKQPTLEQNTKLQQLSKDLEASFLAEMLKTAGFGKAREGMGGGIGEEQFSSFMVQEQARSMVETGGIGLAEHIFNALKRENS